MASTQAVEYLNKNWAEYITKAFDSYGSTVGGKGLISLLTSKDFSSATIKEITDFQNNIENKQSQLANHGFAMREKLGYDIEEYDNYTVYPDMYDLYNCFRFTPFENVKVVHYNEGYKHQLEEGNDSVPDASEHLVSQELFCRI